MTIRGARTLARFATQSGRLTNEVVKSKLFEPNRALELSVFQIDDLDRTEIQEIGIDVVTAIPNAQRLHGWGEISETAAIDAGLRVDYDDNPPRHANVLDWPDEASERKLIQQILASHARAIRLNPPIQVEK